MIEIIDKKLREARYALEKMRKQEAKAFGDKEPFDFLLSAFLTVTTSACDAAIDKWTAIWKDGLSPDERVSIISCGKTEGLKFTVGAQAAP